MAKQIIVTVAADGSISVETKGYKGRACQDASRELERALGVVQETKPTAEMWSAPAGQAISGEQ